MQSTFEKEVYSACKRIPRGMVSTYAEIARAINNPRACRAVGNALNRNPYTTVPCHRVVCSDGRVGGFAYGRKRKESLLRKEGISIRQGKIVDFRKVFKKL